MVNEENRHDYVSVNFCNRLEEKYGVFIAVKFCMLMHSTAQHSTVLPCETDTTYHYFAVRLTSECVIYVGGVVLSHRLIVAHLPVL